MTSPKPAFPAVRCVAIAANLEKENSTELVSELVERLDQAGFTVSLDDELAPLARNLKPASQGVPDACDALIAVGGDGTILKVARRYVDREIPIVGVKGGRLGFLTEATPERVVALLRDGTFEIQRRMRIHGEVRAASRALSTFSALNDFVVHSTGYSRMVRLRVEVGGKLLRELSADGLIVATPTGSTAYSLSAGGPVVEPTLDAIILTPLNPHTMSIRPLVVDATETVEVHVLAAPSGLMVTVDGQEGVELDVSHRVAVSRDPRVTKLLVSDDYDFFALLREKL